MKKQGNATAGVRASQIAAAIIIAAWTAGEPQAGPSMAQWRALVPPATEPTMPGHTGGACPAKPAGRVEMTHAEGMSGLRRAWICVRERWGAIVARDALEEAIAAERPAMIRHQRATAELEVERARVGWRLHEGEWMPSEAFEALLRGQLGLAARDRSRHQGGVTKGDPDAGMRRATAQALRDSARGQTMSEAEYRAENSPNPGPPDPVTGLPGPPQIRHVELDPELIARAIGYGNARKLAAPMPLHETMIVDLLDGNCPAHTTYNDSPYPCGRGKGKPGASVWTQHAPGAHDPHDPHLETVRAVTEAWSAISADPKGFGAVPPTALGEEAAARIRCAFTKHEEGNERGGSRSRMKPMIGLDIMEVCQEGGGGGGRGGAGATTTNCEFECNPDIVLHTGSPAAWLHAFKRERFAACLTEGIDRESESPWLRPRCERPIEWQYARAAQGAEPAFVRWSRMGGPDGSTAEAVVRGLERRRAHYPAEPALDTAQSVMRGWMATLEGIPIKGSGESEQRRWAIGDAQHRLAAIGRCRATPRPRPSIAWAAKREDDRLPGCARAVR